MFPIVFNLMYNIVYFDKYKYEKIDFEKVAFFLLLIDFTLRLLSLSVQLHTSHRVHYRSIFGQIRHEVNEGCTLLTKTMLCNISRDP